MFSLVLKRKRNGSRPAFELIMTAPEVKSPYSTEGIPRITSMDSILSVEIARTSTPPAGEDVPPKAVPAPVIAGLTVCRLALLETGAPSRIIRVPKLFILAASSSPSVTPGMPEAFSEIIRRFNWEAYPRFGLVANPPGNNCITSPRLVACI